LAPDVDLPLVDRPTCQDKLRTIMRKTFELDESFLCAGGKVNMDTCEGDGGGPLVCPLTSVGDGNDETFVQVFFEEII